MKDSKQHSHVYVHSQSVIASSQLALTTYYRLHYREVVGVILFLIMFLLLFVVILLIFFICITLYYMTASFRLLSTASQ